MVLWTKYALKSTAVPSGPKDSLTFLSISHLFITCILSCFLYCTCLAWLEGRKCVQEIHEDTGQQSCVCVCVCDY